MVDNGFAQTIRAERERLRMTQSAFSDRIGCSLATLKRWETGQVVPGASQREFVFQAIQSGSAPQASASGFHAGWWLRIARKRKRLTIREAASVTQTSSSAWHRYESGASALGTQQAIDLTLAMGTPSRDLPQNTESPTGELERADALMATNPAEALRLAVGALMSLRLGGTDANSAPLLGNGHACLGKLLVATGDYSLGGMAFSEAIRLHRLHRFDLTYDRANLFISTAWIGFRLSGCPKSARQRMAWVESRIQEVPKREVASYCMPRAIYADQAGRPDLAAEIIRDARRLPTVSDCSQSYELLSAWLCAKYGDPREVPNRIADLFDTPNVSTRFAARKIALDASCALRDWSDAGQHYRALRGLERDYGIQFKGYSAAQIRALEA